MAIFKKGDKVKIKSVGGVYTTYIKWIVNKAYDGSSDSEDVREVLSHYTYDKRPKTTEGVWTVITVGEHGEVPETVVLIDNGKEAYMFDSKYLIPDEDFLKWTDLKLGDCIKAQKRDNSIYMVTGIDCSKDTERHILAGNTWLFDEEIKHCVKVEEENKC